MNRKFGFTIVELLVAITIMVILLILSVVNLRSSQANARDEERKTDISNIALVLEDLYVNGTSSNPTYRGSYPYTTAVSSSANIDAWFTDTDRNSLRAPGVTAPTYSIVPATSSSTNPTSVTPQPTTSTYVYQPLTSTGALCNTLGSCRKFNLYYLLETTAGVQVVTSKNQ